MSTDVPTQPRVAQVARKTKETDVRIDLTLDGTGTARIDTGIPFLDHMLDLFSRHGLFDLDVECRGDLQIDDHHSVEDVAICLGQAFLQTLGHKAGIARYGMSMVPMDEALCRAVVDLSGRFYLVYEGNQTRPRRELLRGTCRTFLALICRSLEVQSSHRSGARPQHAPHSGSDVQIGGSRSQTGSRTRPAN